MAHSNGFQPTASTLDALLSQSTGGMRANSVKCCCGRPECAYLEHNDAALRSLEQDLQSAAQIGQALLTRHEAYMSEAEEDRRKMGATVDTLEEEKKNLEASNAKTIEENRYLLDQLEGLNNAVTDADSEIMSLNTTLQSTVKELDRLTALAAQATHLEKQLASLESEQHSLQQELMSKEDGEKSAIQRWKNAERTINALQEQLEQIEKEAREEQARHAEVVSRFERRRLVEKELENAAGRLKGAAAAKGLSKEDSNHSVVSSFVKDILQDNANLQLGIVELREMLMGSNEEVENLREQMVLHQPVLSNVDKDSRVEVLKPSSLDNELARTPTAEVLPDFHVHHHYHAAPNEEAKKTPVPRRPKKRRNITSPGLHTPGSGSQTPRTPTSNPMRLAASSSAATILAQTSVTIPSALNPSHTHQWSMSQAPSSTALSSIPGSPVFDALSDVPDSSRPTTPGSTYYGSPQLPPRHSKRGSDVSDYNLSFGQQVPQSISSILRNDPQDDLEDPHFPMLDHNTIPEESEDNNSSSASRPSTKDTTTKETYDPTQLIRPTLHRASSHESLLSARGLDIPKMRSKPSTTQLLSSGRRPTPTTLGTSITSGVALTSATAATAHRSKAPRGFDSKASYSNLLSAASSATSTSPPGGAPHKSSLGTRVGSLGGWIAGRWGVAPASATGEGVTSPTSSVFSRTSAESGSKDGHHGGGTPTQTTPKTATSAQSNTREPFDDLAARKLAHNRLSTHIEPVHLNDSLLQESLSEERVPTLRRSAAAIAVAESAKLVKRSGGKVDVQKKKGGSAVDQRLSTHVEAVSVDGVGLADALGDL